MWPGRHSDTREEAPSWTCGDQHLRCPLTSMGQVHYTNTQTHAHTGGLFCFLFCFERRECTYEGKTEQGILFRALDFLMGNKSGESSAVLTTIWMLPDHRPQREKHTISLLLRLLDRISNMITTGPRDLTHMSMGLKRSHRRDKTVSQSWFRYDTICMCMRTSRNTANTGSRMLHRWTVSSSYVS